MTTLSNTDEKHGAAKKRHQIKQRSLELKRENGKRQATQKITQRGELATSENTMQNLGLHTPNIIEQIRLAPR